ncbi:MAG: bifunctional diaminohydroxyphosphoribosylaminopyrimidine deaminase/5-amino-6-(5-phosphoribosylamino)uracil reductase RibD [Phycisphaerales bacterium]
MTDTALVHLRTAARLAVRGFGHVEPGAMVGCVITAPGGAVIGLGHHRGVGRPHAEAEALAGCRQRGHDPAGATVYVTLEPCAKPGRNPPCAAALIAAKVGAVVYAQRDPNPLKAGGAALLESAGIACQQYTGCVEAMRVGDPFIKRITTGLPWVIAKWAQTIDGRIATRTGASQWISSTRSRQRVHRLRAGVSAILTAIGTVLADDPLLTARGVPLRRRALRVVVDGALRTPPGCRLVATAREAPLLIATSAEALARRGQEAAALTAAGARLLTIPDEHGMLDLRALLGVLFQQADVASVLLECGPTLTGAMLRAGLVDEAHVYTGPLLLGDDVAPGPVAPGPTDSSGEGVPLLLSDARRLALVSVRRMGDDIRSVYRLGPHA